MLNKLRARFFGLTARIDRGKRYFTSKQLFRGDKVDIKAGLYNRVIRDKSVHIVCPSGDFILRRYKNIWVAEPCNQK